MSAITFGDAVCFGDITDIALTDTPHVTVEINTFGEPAAFGDIYLAPPSSSLGSITVLGLQSTVIVGSNLTTSIGLIDVTGELGILSIPIQASLGTIVVLGEQCSYGSSFSNQASLGTIDILGLQSTIIIGNILNPETGIDFVTSEICVLEIGFRLIDVATIVISGEQGGFNTNYYGNSNIGTIVVQSPSISSVLGSLLDSNLGDVAIVGEQGGLARTPIQTEEDTLTLSQDISGINYGHLVEQTLHFTNILSFSVVHNIADTLTLTQNIIPIFQVKDVLHFNSSTPLVSNISLHLNLTQSLTSSKDHLDQAQNVLRLRQFITSITTRLDNDLYTGDLISLAYQDRVQNLEHVNKTTSSVGY